MKPSLRKALIAHSLSKYDVFLFGFLAPILKPLFFPANDFISTLSVFASFAAGYLIRPLGALYFGHLGDKTGRKNAFMKTILFLIAPTFIIGLLPGYKEIGISASIIIILSRLVQGFGSGGEFSGVAVYSTEMSSQDKIGFTGGIVRSVGFLGTALGTGIASIMTLSFMPDWGWRITFIIGGIATLYSYYLRRKMSETQDFEAIKKKTNVERKPILSVFKNHKKKILAIFLVSSCAYIHLYMSSIYVNSLYSRHLSLPHSYTLLISTGIMLLWMLITPFAGRIADRVGVLKYLTYINFISLIITPLSFYFCLKNITFTSLLELHICSSCIGAFFFGPVPALFKTILPTNVRYSGTAMSNTLAQAILGGTAPFFATLFTKIAGTAIFSGVPVFLGSFLAIFGIKLCYTLCKGNTLSNLTHTKRLQQHAT
tara:strand:- start:3674 stop:4957 length:1284 start_codon:yes stop_codon:yes gene_type:complete